MNKIKNEEKKIVFAISHALFIEVVENINAKMY